MLDKWTFYPYVHSQQSNQAQKEGDKNNVES